MKKYIIWQFYDVRAGKKNKTGYFSKGLDPRKWSRIEAYLSQYYIQFKKIDL